MCTLRFPRIRGENRDLSVPRQLENAQKNVSLVIVDGCEDKYLSYPSLENGAIILTGTAFAHRLAL